MTEIIKAENISKVFMIPHQKRTTLFEGLVGFLKGQLEYEKFFALKNINFQIKKGEFLAIIGENGSGKSTLLKIMAGILVPTFGRLEVSGQIVPLLELGLGFQQDLSGRENVYLYGIFMGLARAQVEQKIERIFNFAGVAKFIDTPLKNYSSGMQARLAFATAIETAGEIFLVDEILAVGDENFYNKCLKVFENFKKSGRTLVFVSHNLPLVERLCDRALFLAGGEQIFTGSVKEAIQLYRQDYEKKLKEAKNYETH